MAYEVRFDRPAEKEFRRLDRQVQKRIADFIRRRVAVDPRGSGSALKGDLVGLWRYRIGDYRLVVRIDDEEVVVIVVRVASRGRVYG